MNLSIIRGALLASTLASLAFAGDFPLTYKAVDANEALMLPSNPGVSGTVHLEKLAHLKEEPPAKSARPLYGMFGDRLDANTLLFRLDESGGTGTGYDRLILDLNGNQDLRDDPVIPRDESRRIGSAANAPYELAFFNGVPAPEGKALAKLKAKYNAQVTLQKRLIDGSDASAMVKMRTPAGYNRYVGNLRLQAAGYLETTATLAGKTYRIAVLDANGNFEMGDGARKPVTYKSSVTGGLPKENWYLPNGDMLLCDADGSGRYEYRPLNPEGCPFGPIAYFGGAPYRVSLKDGHAALTLEPWTEPMGELVLQEKGETRVTRVALAWEDAQGDWQHVSPEVVNGKVRVPAGNYRLTACAIVGPEKESVRSGASATLRLPMQSIALAAGEAKPLVCGGPLTAKLDTRKQGVAKDTVVLNATLVGAAGEVYGVVRQGKDFRGNPPSPKFTITTSDGKQVASGNMEYG